ncbi:MAG: RsmB/NOP family class I SAM-dependent RNA methyltransferase [Candidatus Pacearchaeota archaeon]
MKAPKLKPLLEERMKKLLSIKKDFNRFLEIIKQEPQNSIRCNTLKIDPENLRLRLNKRGWIVEQPFREYPEVMIVKNELLPGELGRSIEHLLGYYYVQEIASILPAIVLNPKSGERILDLAASPGSKTTQISALMRNKGTIIANEVNLGRIKILASNLERCGVSNVIITKKEGAALCKKLKEKGFLFDRILLDAPCSGEGTLRSNFKTALMWNINMVRKMAGIQKNLLQSSIEILKKGGVLVYSTCTHAPEENEEVLDFALRKFKGIIEIEKINLPLKFRPGITSWNNKNYDKSIEKCCRIYPHENNTEGFFIAKLKKIR